MRPFSTSQAASDSYYQEPRFPPPGSKTARVFNGLHKTVVFGIVGGCLFLSTYVVSAVKYKFQHKQEQKAKKEKLLYQLKSEGETTTS